MNAPIGHDRLREGNFAETTVTQIHAAEIGITERSVGEVNPLEEGRD
jgi:hypothetical protein